MSNMENMHQYTLRGYFDTLKSEVESHEGLAQESILKRVLRSLDQIIPTAEGTTKQKLTEIRAEVEGYLHDRKVPSVDTMKPMKKATRSTPTKKAGTS